MDGKEKVMIFMGDFNCDEHTAKGHFESVGTGYLKDGDNVDYEMHFPKSDKATCKKMRGISSFQLLKIGLMDIAQKDFIVVIRAQGKGVKIDNLTLYNTTVTDAGGIEVK